MKEANAGLDDPLFDIVSGRDDYFCENRSLKDKRFIAVPVECLAQLMERNRQLLLQNESLLIELRVAQERERMSASEAQARASSLEHLEQQLQEIEEQRSDASNITEQLTVLLRSLIRTRYDYILEEVLEMSRTTSPSLEQARAALDQSQNRLSAIYGIIRSMAHVKQCITDQKDRLILEAASVIVALNRIINHRLIFKTLSNGNDFSLSKALRSEMDRGSLPADDEHYACDTTIYEYQGAQNSPLAPEDQGQLKLSLMFDRLKQLKSGIYKEKKRRSLGSSTKQGSLDGATSCNANDNDDAPMEESGSGTAGLGHLSTEESCINGSRATFSQNSGSHCSDFNDIIKSLKASHQKTQLLLVDDLDDSGPADDDPCYKPGQVDAPPKTTTGDKTAGQPVFASNSHLRTSAFLQSKDGLFI